MCGIIGIIDQQNRTVPEAMIAPALEALQHRGPNGSGTFVGPAFAFGHRRLAIFDLSEQGRQPMRYGDLVIVFNGAIYNFPELRAELEQVGCSFQSRTDTEVILAAYAHWGPSCVSRFNGQWAFAIYDPARRQIFCSRDRFGIKPFYYTTFAGRFHFASEIKAFAALAGWRPQLQRTRSYEFLAYGLHDHTHDCLFAGVSQLPPGCNLVYDLNTHQYRIDRYYNLRDQLSDPPISFSEARDEFRRLLADAVQLRLRSDVKLGSALSGGLDSSSVVGLMGTMIKGEQLTTVSVCFPGLPAIDESAYIDDLQNRQDFRSLRITPGPQELEQLVDEVTWHQDEPLTGPGAIAQFLVFRTAAAHGIRVMLDGQGGDEILAGYEKFYAPYFRGLLSERPAALAPALWNFMRLHHWSYQRIFDKMQALNSKTKGLVPAWLDEHFRPPADALFRPAAFRTVRELSLQLMSEMGLPTLLHYEDRNAMAHGVESRLPFLDHRLVAFCLSLPDNFKLHKGRRKVILREAMRELLPDSIYQRYDKLGFAVPSWTLSPQQLQESLRILNGTSEPILNDKIDLTKLPVPVQQRIFYFARFLLRWQ